jgi:transposase-like protein
VRQYSAERKEALLRQMMPPQNRLVSELARESGITEQTLYTWRRQLRNQGMPVPGSGKMLRREKPRHVAATVSGGPALNAARTLLRHIAAKGGMPRTNRASPRSPRSAATSMPAALPATTSASSACCHRRRCASRLNWSNRWPASPKKRDHTRRMAPKQGTVKWWRRSASRISGP